MNADTQHYCIAITTLITDMPIARSTETRLEPSIVNLQTPWLVVLRDNEPS